MDVEIPRAFGIVTFKSCFFLIYLINKELDFSVDIRVLGMNEWMNEWMGFRVNERTNDRTNEGTEETSESK